MDFLTLDIKNIIYSYLNNYDIINLELNIEEFNSLNYKQKINYLCNLINHKKENNFKEYFNSIDKKILKENKIDYIYDIYNSVIINGSYELVKYFINELIDKLYKKELENELNHRLFYKVLMDCVSKLNDIKKVELIYEKSGIIFSSNITNSYDNKEINEYLKNKSGFWKYR
jgi:hypothetical protein